ncbi:hypothetical protein GCM10011425_35670 [Mucilaginibacter galii]|uniref:Uncharacterized protein n=1 Tax=Mucilaginibacter galii TaxID=2005073 RepID=A0A917N2V5_9SPHI|nr:DUF6358 family protein [Mucilaginibacter galii]GGI52355.1 hypothetical protein GCM10011425_35670 [Mucilaginibacter galii]
MAGKMFLSVVYNIAIFICLYTVYWGFTNHRYDFLTGAVVLAAIFIVLKVRLLKEVRAMEDPKTK